MPADLPQLYKDILAAVGGVTNISTLGNCMTRLRFTVHDESLVSPEKLRKIPDVAGYFYSGSQHQLIVGPATAGKLANYFREQYPFDPILTQGVYGTGIKTAIGDAQANKIIAHKKYSSRLSRACARIGNIFLPLIPAYIGSGLILGVANILDKTVGEPVAFLTSFLLVVGKGIFFYLLAAVGYNASKEFGGTPALGLALAGVLNMPDLAAIEWGGLHFTAGKGGVIAVLFVCYAASKWELFLKKRIKNSLEMFLTPLLTLLVISFLALLVIQPVCAVISEGLTLFTQFSLHYGGALTGAALGGLFLPLVMIGVHQSLIPIHQQLMDSLGANPLFPILCMAGAGQIGASLAVFFRTKNDRLKEVIKNALPVGLLGVGEPLIYGVTLPLFKPFVAACIGGAAGGAVVALFHATSAIPFGVSGLVLLFALSDGASTLGYLVGYLTAAVVGFICAWYLKFDDPHN